TRCTNQTGRNRGAPVSRRRANSELAHADRLQPRNICPRLFATAAAVTPHQASISHRNETGSGQRTNTIHNTADVSATSSNAKPSHRAPNEIVNVCRLSHVPSDCSIGCPV